jgi:transketolase
MRKAFVATLTDLATSDPRIVLLTADLGYMALEPFADRFPDRFFNVGVAEQDMVGIATGMAEAGFVPFVYSIVTFATLRSFEFIRNGPIVHQLPVRIVGIGGGFEYGSAGISHFGLEDVGVLRTQPGITVIAPADAAQTRSALRATQDISGPIYFRLGKDDNAIVPGLDGRFALGRAQTVRDGGDFLIVAMGSIAVEAVAAADLLFERGISARVLIIASVNPVPRADLVEALGHFPLALTVEAHYVTGGVGSLVAEVIAEDHLDCRLVRCAVNAVSDGITGSASFLNERNGLSRGALVETAMRELGKSRHGAQTPHAVVRD